MRSTHAVVLGGSLAGMLAASALANNVDAVTVIERDRLPDEPAPRPGLPQAHHAHILMSGGARTIDDLLSGTIDRLIAAGAHRIGIPNNLVSLTAQGWLRRFPEMQFMITCSRGLLDWVVRDQVLRNHRITVRQHTEGVALGGDRTAVTAVLVQDREDRRQTRIEADLVVDATGRNSRMKQWLTAFGLPEVREQTVDSGLAYATRIFQAPHGTADKFPIINVQADPRAPHPGQTATLLPIENGQWLVTLSGTRGGEPTTDEDRFLDFAQAVRHPVVANLIATAHPLTPVHGSHSTANRRLYFERLNPWPDGLLVLGDAVATYNPVYGHGMSVAAHSASTLDTELRRHGLTPGTARRIQRGIARTVNGAWTMATNQDILYPNAVGKPLSLIGRIQQRYVDRLARTATTEPSVAAALINAFTLSAPMAALVHPKIVLSTLRGPRHPAVTEPPLTDDELAFLPD